MGVTIVGVGAGGIGYYLYEPLLKYLEYGGFEGDLIILDPDKIESKNLARQFGPWALDWNKAVPWRRSWTSG
jgi:molybdopterin/thiamine biosynthesis adenylyltransferase